MKQRWSAAPSVYITGVAESALGEVKDQSAMAMLADASRSAVRDAGVRLHDVDGLFVFAMGDESTVRVSEYLGLTGVTYSDSTDLGGGSFEAYVNHAAAAIAAGRCSVALIAFASRQRSQRARTMVLPSDTTSLERQFQAPYGLPAPIGHYALIAARHMHEYGTTPEQLAAVAVTANTWAQRNPKAWRYGQPITVEDVLASRMICSPLRKYDCCLITDGGGAVVVTDRAHVDSSDAAPIQLLGAGESVRQWHIAQAADLTSSPGRASAQTAFEMAGLSTGDIDVLAPYDGFTINVLLALEDMGFCAPGESGAFVEAGELGPGGSLPAMTSGGGLSYNHPGAYGLLLLIEAVRQLRGGLGDRQVPNAEVAAVQSFGGFMSAAQTLILGRG